MHVHFEHNVATAGSPSLSLARSLFIVKRVIMCTGDIDDVDRCDIDWLGAPETDYCYRSGPSHSRTASFTRANEICVSEGGSLAVPTNSFLHNFTTAAFIYPS